MLDNEKGTCMLIDVVISGDRSVIKKKKRDNFTRTGYSNELT